MRPTLKVLLVDDNVQLLDGVARFLTKRGLSVLTSSSAIGVRALIRKHVPDVVILDVMMPALDGSKLAKLMQETPGAPPRIVFFSAIAEEDLRQVSQRVPGSVYVTKTDGPAVLYAAICAVAKGAA